MPFICNCSILSCVHRACLLHNGVLCYWFVSNVKLRSLWVRTQDPRGLTTLQGVKINPPKFRWTESIIGIVRQLFRWAGLTQIILSHVLNRLPAWIHKRSGDQQMLLHSSRRDDLDPVPGVLSSARPEGATRCHHGRSTEQLRNQLDGIPQSSRFDDWFAIKQYLVENLSDWLLLLLRLIYHFMRKIVFLLLFLIVIFIY